MISPPPGPLPAPPPATGQVTEVDKFNAKRAFRIAMITAGASVLVALGALVTTIVNTNHTSAESKAAELRTQRQAVDDRFQTNSALLLAAENNVVISLSASKDGQLSPGLDALEASVSNLEAQLDADNHIVASRSSDAGDISGKIMFEYHA